MTMTALEAIILGLVQGLTEFLPVSSTGHLILAREVLGLNTGFGLAVDATLHFATAFAVIIYFRKELWTMLSEVLNALRGYALTRETKLLLGALILGTIPAVAAGLLLEDAVETVFRNAELVAWVLVAGSVLFLVAEWALKRYEEKRELTHGRGFVVGCFQALALLPGMSRSGSTISGGMLLGLSREEAARFAFLLSLPIIIGAGSLKLLELGGAALPAGEWGMIALAAIASFGSGVAAIHYLLRFLKNHSLMVFVVYRLALAAVVLAVV
jgi:undecaprenyl-diphosphatase